MTEELKQKLSKSGLECEICKKTFPVDDEEEFYRNDDTKKINDPVYVSKEGYTEIWLKVTDEDNSFLYFCDNCSKRKEIQKLIEIIRKGTTLKDEALEIAEKLNISFLW